MLMAFSFAAAVFAIGIEYYLFLISKPQTVYQSKIKSLEKPLEAPVDPVEMIPESVKGFTVKMRQKVPNKQNAAEAIFKSDAIKMQTAIFNTYVRITYNGSEEKAVFKIKSFLNERYSSRARDITIGGQIAITGYSNDLRSCYIAWTWQNYSIEVESSFIDTIPHNREKLILRVSKIIAISTNNKIQEIDSW